MRRLLIPLAVVGLTALVAAGLLQARAGDRAPARAATPAFHLDRALASLRGAPAPLAGLHAQAAEVLGGGERAFARRLARLAGHPVVVNKWASWCGPCRAEFPFFQREATVRGKEVAFLGLLARDHRGPAERFLAARPVPFPTYEDRDGAIAQRLGIGGQGVPMTALLDERGEVAFIHSGAYRSEAELARDIKRYLHA
jgi:thiol-disulfide isomerase/thioredoxin